MSTCTVIFRDSDDNFQHAYVGYEGIVDDRGRLVLTMCSVLDLTEAEVRSGDVVEDIATSISLNENLLPHQVIVDCEIEFEIMDEVTEIKCKAA